MSTWWDMSELAIAVDAGARAERHLAYFKVFYGSEEGRQVFADLRNEVECCFALPPPDASLSERAVEYRALKGFLEMIRRRAGVVHELDVVTAEAAIAQRYQPPQQQKQDTGDIYEEA